MTAPAEDTFSELTLPFIGMERMKSLFSFTSLETPSPSEPSTNAAGVTISVLSKSSPPASAAYIQTPRFFRSSMVDGRFVTLQMRRCSSAPADDFETVAVKVEGLFLKSVPALICTLNEASENGVFTIL